MKSKRCVLSLSCRSDGSTELAEVFAKSKGGSQFGRWPNASRVSTHKWTTWPNRQEACKTVVFGGGLEFSPVFTYNSFAHNTGYVQK